VYGFNRIYGIESDSDQPGATKNATTTTNTQPPKFLRGWQVTGNLSFEACAPVFPLKTQNFKPEIREPVEKHRWRKFLLFFEEIVKSLMIFIYDFGGSSTTLLFNQNLCLEQWAYIVGTFIGHTDLYNFNTFVQRRRIKVQAVPAGMKIRIAMIAFIGGLYLIVHLYFRSTVVASGNQMESSLDSSPRSLLSRRWLGLFFPA